MTVYSAAPLARAWLSVIVAAASDRSRPQMDRTVLVQAFRSGVRLVATDAYMLLRTWVPNIEDEFALEPDLDEAPYASAVAHDPHGRAKGFMAHALKLVGLDEDELVEIRLNLGVVDEADQADRPAFAGFEVHYVTMELPDAEKVKLRTHEGEYVAWPRLFRDFAAVQTEAIAMSPDIIARLAKVGKVNGGKLIGWRWGGEKSLALVEVVESDPFVDGVVMPARWDFERNAPAIESESEEGDRGEPDTEEPGPSWWNDAIQSWCCTTCSVALESTEADCPSCGPA